MVWKDAQHLTGLNSGVLGIVPNYRVTSLTPFCFREEWEFAVSQDASLFYCYLQMLLWTQIVQYLGGRGLAVITEISSWNANMKGSVASVL